MTGDIPKFVDARGVCQYIPPLGNSFALVQNPPYVFPPYEAYPLAPPHTCLDEGLEAAVMDMDGTTTTTEALCIESLATMVSCMTGNGREGAADALSPDQDYPHIIGNSTTRHVEYLVTRYRDRILPQAVCEHLIRAAAWNMTCGIDPRRAEEARTTLITQGISAPEDSPEFLELCEALSTQPEGEPLSKCRSLAAVWLPCVKMDNVSDLTRIGIEIYYQHYHELLANMGNTRPAVRKGAQPLIEPMPGIGIALALLKGWLGEDAGRLADRIVALLPDTLKADRATVEAGKRRMGPLGAYFKRYPVKLALVTSSIATEAKLVLREVFRVIASQIEEWEVSPELRGQIQQRFSDPARFYDAFVTASDSSEIRLKPHRDLYSIALHTLGVPPERFHRVAGFEDSESGVIAIRAAGIPLCCALPFAMTAKHGFEAATWICPGGMPEVMVVRNFFLPVSFLS
ncbi:MAG: hypothetical protein BWX80_01756 [Candidatus Hydrogenedentes bacterium ADurb.Bin101]|nr:MAG: hypothetical protein BWX80_01756 [Candidatus Hydrogenedentes bacterium ADurb.Bin101]HOC67165.1 hypothetical protein [Candidatus Hydrogenedentota bacterium]